MSLNYRILASVPVLFIASCAAQVGPAPVEAAAASEMLTFPDGTIVCSASSECGAGQYCSVEDGDCNPPVGCGVSFPTGAAGRAPTRGVKARAICPAICT